MQPVAQSEPVWKRTNMYRLGPQYRTHPDRFVHINDVGWFVRLRGEFNSIDGLESSSGLAGPFSSRDSAEFYLQRVILKDNRQPTDRRLTAHTNAPV